LASLEIDHHNLRRSSSSLKGKATAKSTQVTKTLRQNQDAPVILYPPNSFFGELLCGQRIAGQQRNERVVVESAFSVGIKELVLAGAGLAWLPMSMIHAEVQSGSLIVCDAETETIPLVITLFARPSDEPAAHLCSL
jgi:DNA-binding transcriptional LysR family regulator